jgi:peptidyl-tRNA hydrolase
LLYGRERTSAGKIAVSVKNEEALLKCVGACKEAGLVAASVKGAGRPVFDEPTFTVGAVGACYRKDLPELVSRLRLFEDWPLRSGE